jgi:predicted porin
MQAFLETSVKAGKETIKRTTHNYDLDVKAMILNNPSLYYELYYFFNRVELGPTAVQRYDLSNSLNVNHRFSQIFSGKARVGIENAKREDEKIFAYFYDASLIADPLWTLHNTLTFSGRNEEVEGRPNNVNSLFLYNTAKLYQGIDIGLNGGVSFTKQENGEKGRDFTINLQANIIPHRTMSLNLNYSDTLSRRTGGERGSSSKNIQTLDFSVSYNPLRTLNLYATVQVIVETGQKTQTTQNYAINWSPFPDGALQYNLAYNENYDTQNHLKERIFQPSIRYNLSKRSYIDVSYQMIHSKSDIEKTDSNLLSTTVKIFF